MASQPTVVNTRGVIAIQRPWVNLLLLLPRSQTYWGRMVVRATVGAAGGIAGTQHDCQIVRKRTTFGDVTVFDRFLAEI